MRVGSLVYATQQGLGILGKAFVDHNIVTDVMVITHGRHPEQSWYPSADRITDLRDSRQQSRMREFCASMDVCLFFETPFDWSLINYCKKSVLIPMYECTPERLPTFPDLILCPSTLDYKVFTEKYIGELDKIKYLPVPVEYPWKLRTKAEVFVHNAGHGGLKGRNGTTEFLEAIRHVKSEAQFILRTQQAHRILESPRLKVESEVSYESLFSQGDVFVFPERFNGLSLPLQEARASGMLVMCGDRFPMNKWLPTKTQCDACDGQGCKMYQWAKTEMRECGGSRRRLSDGTYAYFNTQGQELGLKTIGGLCSVCGTSGEGPNPLIPVSGYVENRIGPPYMKFREAQFDPKVIAAKIDEWYGKDITTYSESGREWAKAMSWDVLAPQYKKVLEEVIG